MPTRHARPVTRCAIEPSTMELMLSSLPVQHQEILVATYFRGHTTREAARLLGLHPATAKARLFQAMSDLSLMLAARRPDHLAATAAGPGGWRAGRAHYRHR